MNAPNAQAAAAPLPVSAQIVAKFADLFSDVTKDPLQGNYGDLFASFDIDVNNAQNGVTPSSLRDFIAAAGAQNHLSALGLFSGGVLHPYVCPVRVDRALGAPASTLDGKLYAFDNDLHRNQGSTVEITNGYFNLVPNTVLVSTVPNILTELAADPTLETLGPYANGDANTQVVRSRYIIPIPFKYVNIFLASGITPRRFFLEVYPLMVTDQIDQDCSSLIRFMQIALTVPGPNMPSPIEVIVPVAPPRDTRLLDLREAIIQHHFPALNQSLVGLQQSQIAVQLSQLNQQMAQHRADDQATLANAKAVSLETHYGRSKLDSLLCVSRAANEQGLAPLWIRIPKLKSKKKDVVNLVTELMNEFKDQIGAPHLTVSFNLSMAESLLAMKFDMVHRDSLQTGLNLFLFGDVDEEASLILNNQINLLMSGVTTTLADAKAALKTNVTMPPGDGGSLRYVQRYIVFLMAIFPDAHPLIEWLQLHYQDMDSFRHDFATWQHPTDATLSPARGIYHLKWLTNVTSAYFKAQKRTPANVPLPDTCFIRKQIQNEMAWAPLLSDNFIRDYKVKEFCGIYGPVASPPLPPSSGLPRLPNPPPRPPGNDLGDQGQRAGNLQFNSGLFAVFKGRGNNGKYASRQIRYKITNGDLPALPLSKVDGKAMCLAFHVKGMCNQQCGRNADHVEYNGTEYAPLVEWCTEHYPAAGGAGN